MTIAAPDITIDVDLRNPGQYFACCGLLELSSRLWPGARGWFDRELGRDVFHVATDSGQLDPLTEITATLCGSAPIVKLSDDHEAYPQSDRKPLDLLPFSLRLDWWLYSYREGDKSELKVWAGQQTPERLFNALRGAWRDLGTSVPAETSRRLFWERCPMSGRFGLDPSASWEALDVGFSPDEQGIPVQTSPATEILAAVGLQRCRPLRRTDRRGRWFAYRIWPEAIDVMLVPAVNAGVTHGAAAFEFPVVMRNAQYGSFGWAKPWRKSDEDLE